MSWRSNRIFLSQPYLIFQISLRIILPWTVTGVHKPSRSKIEEFWDSIPLLVSAATCVDLIVTCKSSWAVSYKCPSTFSKGESCVTWTTISPHMYCQNLTIWITWPQKKITFLHNSHSILVQVHQTIWGIVGLN